MADYLTTYQTDLNKVNIQKTVGDLIILNSGIVIREVTERWQHGVSVEGGIIGRYSWADYRLYKQAMNPLASGNVDLMLTGKLAGGLTLRKSGNEYQIFSTDSKYNKIGQKYGFEEFGLTDEQAYEFFEDLYAFALETIFNKLWA